jgi:hypothetical protein
MEGMSRLGELVGTPAEDVCAPPSEMSGNGDGSGVGAVESRVGGVISDRKLTLLRINSPRRL